MSNLRSRAIKIPGITISPRPNIAKLLALSPFSNKSWGNTTEKRDHKMFKYGRSVSVFELCLSCTMKR